MKKEYLNMLNRHIVDGIIAGSHMLDLEEYKNVQGPMLRWIDIWVRISLLYQQIIRWEEDWLQKSC